MERYSADGVQLRRHRGGGRQVPRPRPRPRPPPPPQHDADQRGGVAQDAAEELVVRPQPRRRAQVRVRAGHARRLLQVPPPPQQLPRPRPRQQPGVPSLPGHLRRRAAAGRGRVPLQLMAHACYHRSECCVCRYRCSQYDRCTQNQG